MSERIALVTGGSRGTGKNAVLKLAAEGTGIIPTEQQPAGGAGSCARNRGKRRKSGSIAA